MRKTEQAHSFLNLWEEKKQKFCPKCTFFFPAPSLVWNWTGSLLQCCGLGLGKGNTHSLGHFGTLEGLPFPIFMALPREADRWRRSPAPAGGGGGGQSQRAQFPWPHLKRKGKGTSFTGMYPWILRHDGMLLVPVTWEWGFFPAKLAHTFPRKWLFSVLWGHCWPWFSTTDLEKTMTENAGHCSNPVVWSDAPGTSLLMTALGGARLGSRQGLGSPAGWEELPRAHGV